MGMTISVAVTLICDSLRGPGCEWSYPLGANLAPAAVAARWRHAAELGWTILRDDGVELHLRPVCNGARPVGADVLPPPGEEALPRNIGEAAERDRRTRGPAAAASPPLTRRCRRRAGGA
jgi:hypothetical protein